MRQIPLENLGLVQKKKQVQCQEILKGKCFFAMKNDK